MEVGNPFRLIEKNVKISLQGKFSKFFKICSWISIPFLSTFKDNRFLLPVFNSSFCCLQFSLSKFHRLKELTFLLFSFSNYSISDSVDFVLPPGRRGEGGCSLVLEDYLLETGVKP